jgi:hypothetical protein
VQALVDAPGQTRRQVNFKRLALTDFKLEGLPRAAKKTALAAALKESQAFEKFAASSWGLKLARRKAKVRACAGTWGGRKAVERGRTLAREEGAGPIGKGGETRPAHPMGLSHPPPPPTSFFSPDLLPPCPFPPGRHDGL